MKRLAILLALVSALIGCGGSNEDRARASLQRGRAAAAAGRQSEAVIEYRNAIQVNATFAEARLALAEALASQGQSRPALGEFVRAADLLPDDLDLQVKTGNLLVAVGRVSDARRRAEKVLEKDPNHVEAHILLGNALGGLQNLDDALTQMEEAIRLDSTRAASHLQLAMVQQARGETDDAEAALKRALDLAPTWPGAQLALGNLYWASGRTADAERAFDAALALDPAHAGANRAKAVFAIATGRPLEAEQHLKRLADLSKTLASQLSLADYYLGAGKTADAIALLEPIAATADAAPAAGPRLARAYATLGRRDLARGLIDRLLQQHPKNADLRMLESQLLLDAGRRDEALASARLAVEGDPASAGAQFTLGKVYAALGDASGAEMAFREVLKLNPRATPAQIELSLLRLGEDRPRDAVQLAEGATRLQPGNATARIALVRSLLATGDLARAERELQHVQSQGPSAPGFVQAGVLASAQNNPLGARAAFSKALELDADSVEALAGIVSLDLKSGDISAARARLSQRLAGGSPSLEMMLLAARTFIAVNDLAEAERVLGRAIQFAPAALPAYSMLGQLYVRQGKLDQARAEFDRLSARQARPVGALTMAGTILQVQGNTREARQRFEQAIAHDPSAAVAANNLAWIYADSGEHLDRAVDLAQSALERLPDVPEVLDTLGWAYFKGNRPAMAVTPLSRCVTVAPANAACHYHLGLAQAKTGDEESAQQSLSIALRLQKSGPWAADAQRVLGTLNVQASRQ